MGCRVSRARLTLAATLLAMGLSLAACDRADEAPATAASEAAVEDTLAAPDTAAPQTDARIEQGRTIAETECAGCHSLDPHAVAEDGRPPPMRDMLLRYDPDVLAGDLIEGVQLGHADMPTFDFSVTGADALVAFLKSIRPPAGDSDAAGAEL